MITAPPIARQTRFVMPIADNVRLVSMETARAVKELTAEELAELYEDKLRPDHLPAFNLARHQTEEHRREIYFWAGALRSNPSGITTPEGVIADCLLTNSMGLANQDFHLRTHQLEVAWCISNQTLIQFIKDGSVQGAKVGRNWKINRASAAHFLKGRML